MQVVAAIVAFPFITFLFIVINTEFIKFSSAW